MSKQGQIQRNNQSSKEIHVADRSAGKRVQTTLQGRGIDQITHKPVYSNSIFVEGTLFKVAVPHSHRKVQTCRASVKSAENYCKHS